MQSDDPPVAMLSLVAGLALIDAVDIIAPGRGLLLKWPNDLLLGDSKLAGILLERNGDRIVAGFGVNLAVSPHVEGRETASLDRIIAPEAFAPLLAGSVARQVQRWRSGQTEAILADWQSRAHPIGSPLSVHPSGDELIAGTYDGLEPDGALRLRRVDGSVAIVHAGDVDLA